MTSVVCIASLYCMCLHVVLSLHASSPFRDIVKNRRARGDAKAGGLGEKGELATITHKIFNSTREPLDSAKRKNCHHKRAAAYCVHHKWFLSSATLARASRFARPNGRAFSQDTLHIAFFIRKIEWSTLHGTLCKWHQI